MKKPGDMGLGTMPLNRIDDGKGVGDIAHCAEKNDTDPWVGGEFHEEGKSSLHRVGTSFSEKENPPQTPCPSSNSSSDHQNTQSPPTHPLPPKMLPWINQPFPMGPIPTASPYHSSDPSQPNRINPHLLHLFPNTAFVRLFET